jgi:hypothetical protein
MALSGDSDLIVTLSRELSCRMIGAGDLGRRLPSETTTPFDHPGGMGILAGIHAGGFDVDVLLRSEPGGIQYTMTGARSSAPAGLARQLEEHARTHQLPDAGNWTDRIAIVPDDNADFGFELRAGRPSDPAQPGRRLRSPGA